MSRLLFDDKARLRRWGKPVEAGDDDAVEGPWGCWFDDERVTSGRYRERKDPAGRRSLTGLELRRQRST